jgi:hypothetical protein
LASIVRCKLFQKSSPLKVLNQWKPKLVWIITRVSSFKIVSGDAVHKLFSFFPTDSFVGKFRRKKSIQRQALQLISSFYTRWKRQIRDLPNRYWKSINIPHAIDLHGYLPLSNTSHVPFSWCKHTANYMNISKIFIRVGREFFL